MNASSAVLISRGSVELADILKKEHEGGVMAGRIEIIEHLIPAHLEVISGEIKRRQDEESVDENT
jgi:hypothetical protein